MLLHLSTGSAGYKAVIHSDLRTTATSKNRTRTS
ncbi:hypothetical protein SLEP1_g36790 [Rubroshorea leprosula]|uniref:Uncharacterized protein n=1 Tax=Rubroshorea leprosula TaxID=152421 RepID=A0AAV5KSM3_9ROSI|nr:hypothetical protein SLEP1_g36790 [Rubroshorea leprosula]